MGCWRRSIRTFSLQSLGTWSSDQQVFNNDDTHQSFRSSWSSELDQIQSSFLIHSSELQVLRNWRSSTKLLVFRILWHLVLQSLQVVNAGDVQQNFCLQSLQALDQKHYLQMLGLVHQNFLSKIFRCFFGRSSEHADADDLLIRNTSSEAL